MLAKALRVCFRAVCPPRSFVRSFGQILLQQYLINGLNDVDETYREYSVATNDDLIVLWRSKVKVTAGRRCNEGIDLDAGASKSIL